MKPSPKHYRLMDSIRELTSIPVWMNRHVRAELTEMGLAESFLIAEDGRKTKRYRLTDRGRELLEDYDKRVRREPWQDA